MILRKHNDINQPGGSNFHAKMSLGSKETSMSLDVLPFKRVFKNQNGRGIVKHFSVSKL